MSPRELQDHLRDLLEAVLFARNDAKDPANALANHVAAIRQIATYDDRGILSPDKGLVIETFDGSEFQVTIVPSRPGSGDGNDVAPEDACPTCGECEADALVWQEDGEQVECQECATVYRPGAPRERPIEGLLKLPARVKREPYRSMYLPDVLRAFEEIREGLASGNLQLVYRACGLLQAIPVGEANLLGMKIAVTVELEDLEKQLAELATLGGFTERAIAASRSDREVNPRLIESANVVLAGVSGLKAELTKRRGVVQAQLARLEKA